MYEVFQNMIESPLAKHFLGIVTEYDWRAERHFDDGRARRPRSNIA